MTDLARRSIVSVAWRSGANLFHLAVLFVRSVVLARLLPVEVFGVFAGASAVVLLSAAAAEFGLGAAYLHRAPETEDEDEAAATHFTLLAGLTGVWALIMIAVAFSLPATGTRTALLVLTVTTGIGLLTTTPQLVLTRRVDHRRLAVLQFLRALLATTAAIAMAVSGATLWALLIAEIVGVAVILVGLFVWRPVWRVRMAWNPRNVRYFLAFGGRAVVAIALSRALNRLPDLWSRVALGAAATGFLSRAETFASYPRRILSAPVTVVMGGTYAELKGDRPRLSQAFFRSNAVLVRGGFLLAGFLAVAAPELIRLLIGVKWLPMLDAFRLLLLFALIDPIKQTVATLFNATGTPQTVVWARSVQVVVLVAGLLTLGPRHGIAGVALSVSVTAVVGMAILLWQARRVVDFSPFQLFAAPTLALAAAAVMARDVPQMEWAGISDLHSLAVKLPVFTAVYVILLSFLEWRRILRMVRSVLKSVAH